MQFVFLLLTHIENVILGYFFGGEHKRQQVPDVLQVLRRHTDAAVIKGVLWRKYDILKMTTLIVKGDVENFAIFAGHCVAVESLDFYILTEGVAVARLFKLFFLS